MKLDYNTWARFSNTWFLVPTLAFRYEKYDFLETGIYTPSFNVLFMWLNFSCGMQLQETY